MISVLCPSRGRGPSLDEAIAGLYDMAEDPGSVEVLVAADPDDADTIALVPRLAERGPGPVRRWTAPERYGYARLHEYYNALAAVAYGSWLLLWNDDARMLTPGWDKVIAAEAPGVLWTQSNHGPYFFPAWPKAWSDAWGHASLSANVDVWLGEVGGRLGLARPVPVEVHHDRKDITGGHDDQTYAEGRGLIGSYSNHPDHDSPANREARIRDALIVRRMLG